MKTSKKPFSKEILHLENIEQACDQIIGQLRKNVTDRLNRTGGVIGISGGIDSSVTLALAAKALEPDHILAVMMPEKDSSNESAALGELLAAKFGVRAITENLTAALDGLGCYSRRDEAVKKVFPEYHPDTHKMKIGIKNSGLFTNLPPLFELTIVDQSHHQQSRRIPGSELRQIIAASDFKQRCRMAMLYYHAERLHYAVIGTPNKHEVEQGFFVKYGDGGADVMPIGHLYKTQVYQIARHLGVPQEIIDRTPTTDTYSAAQTQEEFFYQLPFEQMDLLWYGYENQYDPAEIAGVMGMSEAQVRSVFVNFARKYKTTEYLRLAPIRD